MTSLQRLVCGAALAGWILVAAGCSDGEGQDQGVSVADLKVQLDDARLYACPTPGKACNAHSLCAFNPTCGTDLLCRPESWTNCDDKLDCTDDLCAGQGRCTNTPKKGFCRVGYKAGTSDGGVPVMSAKCVAEGARKPGEPCMGCAPTQSDGGTTNNTKWMPVGGGTCDDNDACTHTDTCNAGVCKGTSYYVKCADKYNCTKTMCDGKGGCLGSKLIAGYCLINGTCYKKGDKKSDGSCNTCDPSVSTVAWTPIGNSCQIVKKCYSKGDKHPGGCAECDPAANTKAWTVKGSFCLIDGTCKKPGAKDSTKCDTCDPKKNKYDWSVRAGMCNIGGFCHAKGIKHPKGCAECDPAASASAWTVKGSFCLINNACKKPGDKDGILCASCDPTKSKAAWTPLAGNCKIFGACYKKGDQHPGKCAACDPAKDPSGWTITGTSKACLIDNVCKKSGDKHLSGCATCAPAKSQVTWTATTGLCKIQGLCYQKGAQHPGKCATCDPAKSATSWSPSGTSCVIKQQCVASGTKDKSGCGVCDPKKAPTSWTVASGKNCIVGPNKCVAAGALELGGCGVCNPAKNPNGWTQIPGCKVTHDWSQGVGGNVAFNLADLAVDPVGNLYITGYFQNTIVFGSSAHTSNGSQDIVLASFTPGGKLRWSRSFGSSSADQGKGVAVDAAGSVRITGSFSNSVNFGGSTLTSKGMHDAFVAAFDNSGKHLWSTSFGSSSNDYGFGVGVDGNGNTFATGSFLYSVNPGSGTLTSNGALDVYLARFDSKGKVQWAKGYGGSSSDYSHRLALDPGGNVYITGYFYNSVSFGGKTFTSKGGTEGFVAGYSSSGKHRWSRAIGSVGYDAGTGVATDNKGNVYASGQFYNSVDFGGETVSSLGGSDTYVASYSPGGSLRWVRTHGSTGHELGGGIDADQLGNVYTTGKYRGFMTLMGKTTLTAIGYDDAYFVSYDATGKLRWARSHGSGGNDAGHRVKAAPGGYVYATGYYQSSVDFGGGLFPSGSSTIYLLKLKQ